MNQINQHVKYESIDSLQQNFQWNVEQHESWLRWEDIYEEVAESIDLEFWSIRNRKQNLFN